MSTLRRPTPVGATFIVAVVGIVLVAAAIPAVAGTVVQPDFSPADFTPGAPIDNTYFPLVPGTVFQYEANVTEPHSGRNGLEHEDDIVTSRTKLIADVESRVVRVRTHLNGVLIEDTDDYYAQDKSGNVWYMGEDTKEFEYDDQGRLTGTITEGTWHAGVHGAKPGFIMPKNPQVIGFEFFQENAAADGAVDQAKNLTVNETATTPAGHFTNVLKTLESSPLEPGVLENKLYAPGVGNVLILENLQSDGTPLNTIPLVNVTTAAAVPLPPGAWAALAAAALLLAPRGLRAAGASLRRRS
jgi:hypothetical protein